MCVCEGGVGDEVLFVSFLMLLLFLLLKKKKKKKNFFLPDVLSCLQNELYRAVWKAQLRQLSWRERNSLICIQKQLRRCVQSIYLDFSKYPGV